MSELELDGSDFEDEDTMEWSAHVDADEDDIQETTWEWDGNEWKQVA